MARGLAEDAVKGPPGPMFRQHLAEAMREEKQLKVCFLHPRLVYFDEPECPCCKVERERNECKCLKTKSSSRRR
jgi:hypothetical protein